jgi:hypothetical protein
VCPHVLPDAVQVSLIDKLLTAFIQPLQHDNISTHWQQQQGQYVRSNAAASAAATAAAAATADPAADPEVSGISSSTPSSSSSSSDEPVGVVHRVHCSLNLNTETGRLSARRPNLQNQPAHEKDRYKVRSANSCKHVLCFSSAVCVDLPWACVALAYMLLKSKARCIC